MNKYIFGEYVISGTNVVEAHMNFIAKNCKIKYMQKAYIYEVDTYDTINIYSVIKCKGLFTYDLVEYVFSK